MAEANDPWFVVENSEAIALLLLTTQPGIDVVPRPMKDGGTELQATFLGTDPQPTRRFIARVKGTMSASPSDWAEVVLPSFRLVRPALPVCVILVTVRDNKAKYAWIAEPVAESDRGTLKFHQAPTFHELSESDVPDLVGQVRAYYDAMPAQLLATG